MQKQNFAAKPWHLEVIILAIGLGLIIGPLQVQK